MLIPFPCKSANKEKQGCLSFFLFDHTIQLRTHGWLKAGFPYLGCWKDPSAKRCSCFNKLTSKDLLPTSRQSLSWSGLVAWILLSHLSSPRTRTSNPNPNPAGVLKKSQTAVSPRTATKPPDLANNNTKRWWASRSPERKKHPKKAQSGQRAPNPPKQPPQPPNEADGLGAAGVVGRAVGAHPALQAAHRGVHLQLLPVARLTR